MQALWLLPAVLASALYTSAIGPSGGYPPCKTCEQLPCLRLYSCRLSDYQPLQDSLGVEAAGVFFLAFRAFLASNTFRAFKNLQSVQRTFKAFSFTQSSKKCGELPKIFPHRLNQKLSSRRRQSERRHVDQPRQRNCSQILQGGYPPEGPMAEV